MEHAILYAFIMKYWSCRTDHYYYSCLSIDPPGRQLNVCECVCVCVYVCNVCQCALCVMRVSVVCDCECV